RQQESVVETVVCAVSCNLPHVVDGIGIDQHPAGAGRNEWVQVLCAAGGPNGGVSGVIGKIAVAYDDVKVVDCKCNAVVPPRQRPKVVDFSLGVPLHVVPVLAGGRTVRLTYDNARRIDGIRNTGYASQEGSQVNDSCARDPGKA